MNKLFLSKPQTLLTVLNWLGWPLIVLYVGSMFVVPVYQTGADWEKIQDVWGRWQALNVGMIAFISSLVAFNISKFNAEQQRKRNFLATRSFLPEAFSELTVYCRESMAVFAEAWTRASNKTDRCNTPLNSPVPKLPEGYRQIFRDCIKVAEPDVGDRLSYILVKLQIHHARLTNLFTIFEEDTTIIHRRNIMSYFYGIAEIQALINKIFDYARGLEPFNATPLEWKDYRTALILSGIEIDDFDNLQGFIEGKIARGNGNDKN